VRDPIPALAVILDLDQLAMAELMGFDDRLGTNGPAGD